MNKPKLAKDGEAADILREVVLMSDEDVAAPDLMDAPQALPADNIAISSAQGVGDLPALGSDDSSDPLPALPARPGPQALHWVGRDDQVISPSYTRSYPFVMDKGHGCEVWDVDGHRYLDFNAGVAVLATGHTHPKVVQAIQAQAEKFIHMAGTDFYMSAPVELAERLIAHAPGDFGKRIFYTNSGTESIEAAMKLARWHTKRPVLMSFFGAFHGRTYGSMSLSNSKSLHRTGFQPLVAGIQQVPYPYHYRCLTGGDANHSAEDCGLATVEYIEKVTFKYHVVPTEIAAIFAETIQGEGGYVVPPASFYPALRELADRYEIPLVMDEVQCGMGRTGKMFAIEHWGVTPDVICLAKGIASGVPLGAVIARDSLMTWPSGAHANTFGGNPLAIAAALATLDLLEQELIANAAAMGEYMLPRLQEWKERYAFVGDVRGLGLMAGVELVEDKQTKEYASDLRDAIVDECFKHGLLLLGAGKSVIRLCPPLVITKSELDEGLNIMEQVMDEFAAKWGK